MRQGRRDVVEHQIDLAADQVYQRRCAALVGHMHDVDLRELLVELSRHVDAGAAAARGVNELAGLGSGQRGQFGDRIGLDRRIDDQNVRERHQGSDRGQILVGVVLHLRIEHRVDRLDTAGGHQHRVAVGCRPRDFGAADVAAGTRPVFDGDRLAERFRHLGGNCTRGVVDRAARRKRADQPDRL